MPPTLNVPGQGPQMVGPRIPFPPAPRMRGVHLAPPGSKMPYPRLDKPFRGEGTRVMLRRKPGYTRKGWLPIPFRLQVPPTEDVSRSAAYNWTNFDVIGNDDGASERTRPGGARLRSMQLTSLFLDWEPTWQVWAPQALEPILAVRELEMLCLRGVIFQLTVRDPKLYKQSDVDWLATITQAELKAVNGETDARYFTCTFQEYIPTDAERKSIKDEIGPWSHTIKDGDTLRKLSRKYYKTYTEWKRIARANKGMENLAGSDDLFKWSKRRKKKRIRIPVRPDATTAAHVRGH